jgi:hypothetical protein
MTAPSAPETTEPNVVELIVHGVSGVPPESVLRAPIEEIKRVRGDKSAGFYRRRPDEGPQGQPRIAEAFSWGGLTSGPASRALWFLFLPFILINLANWMLPPAKDKKVAAVSISILRLLGLSLTLSILLAAVSVFVDMIGWQCAGMAQCSARLGPASVLASLPTRGAQLAVTAVPVALLIGALWLFGRSPAPYGEPPDPALTRSEAAPLTQTTFWKRDKSVDRLRSCHLTAAFSALGTLVAFVPLRYSANSPSGLWMCLLIAIQLALFSFAIIATSWNQVTARGGRGMNECLNTCMNRALWPAALGLLFVTLVMVWCTRVEYPNLDVTRDPGTECKNRVKPTLLPGLYEVIASLVAVQVVLIVLLFVLTALSRLQKKDARNLADHKDFAPTLGGFTAPFVALMAWLIGGGLSLGMGLWVARFLGDPVESSRVAQCAIAERQSTLDSNDAQALILLARCGDPDIVRDFENQVRALGEHAPLIIPSQYYAAAIANLVLLVVALLTAGGVFGYVRWRARKRRAAIKTEYGVVEPSSKEQNDCVKKIARTQEWAHVPDWAPNLLAGLLIFAVVDVACWVLLLWRVPVSSSSAIKTAADWSQAVTAFLAAAFVGLVLAAFRDRNTRRAIAVLWDVVTFWPQAAHPLGPPSYGEIAVPKLRDRVSELTTPSEEDSSHKQKKVVLVAHSQGTIISAAMLMQTMVPSLSVAGRESLPEESKSRLPAEKRHQMSSRVAFLTFGCPLHKLYGRNFPAYFGYQVLESLAPKQDELWLNLWAPTDPIGAWVFEEGPTVKSTEPPENAMAEFAPTVVDVRLHDVVMLNPPPPADPPPICGHSGFWTRQEYLDSVQVLDQRLTPESPPSTPLNEQQEKYSLPSEAP